MAFLDDLNRKISQAGQKAKDFSDSARINSLINEEEKKINAYYHQVGKLYVSLHTSDYEPEFDGVMAAIAESEKTLKDLRSQLQLLKGVKKCPQCGGDVVLNSAFCPTCGFRMPQEEKQSDLIRCDSCGQFVAKNLRFCTFCGKPINAIPVVEQPVIPQSAPVVPEPVQIQQPEVPAFEPAYAPGPTPPVYEQPPVAPVFIPTEEDESMLDATIIADAVPVATYAQPNPPMFEQSVSPAPVPPAAGNIFCPVCGTSLPSDSTFCSECGTKLV